MSLRLNVTSSRAENVTKMSFDLPPDMDLCTDSGLGSLLAPTANSSSPSRRALLQGVDPLNLKVARVSMMLVNLVLAVSATNSSGFQLVRVKPKDPARDLS